MGGQDALRLAQCGGEPVAALRRPVPRRRRARPGDGRARALLLGARRSVRDTADAPRGTRPHRRPPAARLPRRASVSSATVRRPPRPGRWHGPGGRCRCGPPRGPLSAAAASRRSTRRRAWTTTGPGRAPSRRCRTPRGPRGRCVRRRVASCRSAPPSCEQEAGSPLTGPVTGTPRRTLLVRPRVAEPRVRSWRLGAAAARGTAPWPAAFNAATRSRSARSDAGARRSRAAGRPPARPSRRGPPGSRGRPRSGNCARTSSAPVPGALAQRPEGRAERAETVGIDRMRAAYPSL